MNNNSQQDQTSQMATETVDHDEFRKLIARRGHKLLGIAKHISEEESSRTRLVRPLLGELLVQSTQLEELLDAYNARNNRRWCLFRSLIAAVKLFADVGYELLHIQYSLPTYQLLPIENDFGKATEEALAFTKEALFEALKRLVEQAYQLELAIAAERSFEEIYAEELPRGRLAHNRRTSRTETVRKTVTLLATAFLNLAAESRRVFADCHGWSQEHRAEVPDCVSEKNLRSLNFRFHNLQSLYDTYVSATETEGLDAYLPVLRGHISVVFHLLQTATLLAHYYERHMSSQIFNASTCPEPVVKPEALLEMLMNYSVAYSSYYTRCAQRLCQEMLKRYAEVGRINVCVPSYRGFHVRPATLISKLVQHYGCEVQMKLGGELYDAGSPLELFRANEKINAEKRCWLSDEIVQLGLVEKRANDKNIMGIVRDVVLTLAQRSRLILHEQPLLLPAKPIDKEGILLEQVTGEIARLQATGKIDVDSDLTVTFIGDKRVLTDIKLLAESGYGEDNFGNNTALPEELTYLRW